MAEKIDGLFVCGLCGMKYREREWAEKCEEWCRRYHSCNPEYARHAVLD